MPWPTVGGCPGVPQAIPKKLAEARGNVKVKFIGPDGVSIDLSEHGWLGAK